MLKVIYGFVCECFSPCGTVISFVYVHRCTLISKLILFWTEGFRSSCILFSVNNASCPLSVGLCFVNFEEYRNGLLTPPPPPPPPRFTFHKPKGWRLGWEISVRFQSIPLLIQDTNICNLFNYIFIRYQ